MTEPNNISATPFDVSTSTYPYATGATSIAGNPLGTGTTSMTASTPAPDVSNANSNAPNGGLNNGLDVSIFDEWNNAGNEMWYLPPGPAFFQNMETNGSVAMTAEGVNVGGLDLLEYMAMDPVQFSGIGEGTGGNNQQDTGTFQNNN